MPRGKSSVLAVLLVFIAPACGMMDDSHLTPDLGSRSQQYVVMPSDPPLSQAHVMRARFFREQGEINKSVQEMEWALAADPYNYEAAYHLGLMYMDLNQRASARRVWEHGLKADQDGVERPLRAKSAAAIRAGLAELERIEKPYESPISILAGQGAYQDSLRGTPIPQSGDASVPEWASRAADASYVAPGIQPPLNAPIRPPESAGMGSAAIASQALPVFSQPGLPGSNAAGQTARTAPVFTPKPYVPSPEDGKPRPTAPASSARSGAGSRAASADCPPCEVQSRVQNSGKYAVLVSSNRRQASAQEQVKSLNSKGYYATMAVNKNSRGTWYVVWAGCCIPEKQAKDMALALNRQGLAREAKAALPR
jgi:tetratricopeptide (TPR) repeat protein